MRAERASVIVSELQRQEKKTDNENTRSNVTKRLLLSEAAAACSLALLEKSKDLLEFQYALTSGLKSGFDCPPTQSSL